MKHTELNFFPFNLPEKDYKTIVYKNRCVVIPLTSSFKHLCGYVVFEKKELPKDWWGNYNAAGLQKLKVHGGITYCRQQMVPNQKEKEKEYDLKIEAVYANKTKRKYTGDKVFGMTMPSDDEMKDLSNRIKTVNNLRKELNLKLSETDKGYVVFGFDCGHVHDEQNEMLKDPNHVMILTEQMEFQLRKFAESYEDYKNAEGVVKNVVRKSIMENIHREADVQCEPGFGAMLEMLAGEDDD